MEMTTMDIERSPRSKHDERDAVDTATMRIDCSPRSKMNDRGGGDRGEALSRDWYSAEVGAQTRDGGSAWGANHARSVVVRKRPTIV